MTGNKLIPYKSIYEMFKAAVDARGDKPGLKYLQNGNWVPISWNEWFEMSKAIAKGLMALGLEKGDRVNILSNTNHKWVITDIGIIIGGGVTVPIYQSNTARESHYIIDHSESRFIFVENRLQLEKVLTIRDDLPRLQKIIVFNNDVPDDADDMIIGFDDFIEFGKAQKNDDDFYKIAESIEPMDLASIVYTSGTTGVPKGVMLPHRNFIYIGAAINDIVDFDPDVDENFAWLPYAHILGRAVQYAIIFAKISTSFARGIDTLLEDMQSAKPTFVVSVPRIYEKIYTKVQVGLESASPIKKALFNWSMGVGRKVSHYKQQQQPLPFALQLKYNIAFKLVLSKIHELFGGRIRFFVSGGAPLSKDIAEFFHAADVLILEGYGLTETTAPANVNRPNKYKFGTVGPVLPGTEEKIADDGEILIRGPGVMIGYYKNPEETREALDPDGWFHTGDIGEFDEEGFLRITDRKKDIIVTAGGKNIAPQYIENLMKTSPYISQCFVYGDKRKYLTALITLDFEQIKEYADSHGIQYDSLEELAKDPQIEELIKKEIEERNRQLASYETIKKFVILPSDFTIETGELTPSLKMKRKVILNKYKELLDSLYEEKFD